MGTAMTSDPDHTTELPAQVLLGDEAALAALFEQYRPRLRQMVRLRIDGRVRGRVDPSDVLQEAYLDIRARLPEYAADPRIPLLLWMRMIVGQRLIDVHRRHLEARMRDARLEVSLHSGPLPQVSSESLAAHLLGKDTSPSRVLERAENRALVQQTLEGMDPLDREVLALRHFEMLTNSECALALGISKSAASNRYVRALMRVKEALDQRRGPHDADRGIAENDT
jgi:RNA polymerase sigma-70 factor (ECF subfamily)